VIVPRALTPVPLAGLLALLSAAHRDLRGFDLDPDAYRLAVAQLELEHGVSGGSLRGVWCFNFGNHDATAADRNNAMVDTFETVPEHEVDAHGRGYLQVHTRRAYPDVESGLEGYWLALLDGFPASYDAMGIGDPDGLAAALKGERYFTADPLAYARALRGLLPPAPST